VVDVVALVEVQGAGELLDVHDVRHFLAGKPQHRERAASARVAAGVERDDLDGHVGQAAGDLREVRQLPAHHRAPADRPLDRSLVQDRPHQRRPRLAEQLLARQPQRHPPLDLQGRRRGVAKQRDGARVVRRLEQPVHELHLERADDRGRRLQAEVLLEPVGGHVGERRPPAGLVRLPLQRLHLGAQVRIGDGVQGEQVIDVSVLEPDPAVFQPADLRARRADRVRGLIRGDSSRGPQPVQLAAKDQPVNGRAAGGGAVTISVVAEHLCPLSLWTRA